MRLKAWRQTFSQLAPIVQELRCSKDVLALATQLVAEREQGFDVSSYEAAVLENLAQLPGAVYGALERLRERAEFPSPDVPPQQFVYQDQILFKMLDEIDDVYQIAIDYIAIADAFGLDASQEQIFIVDALTEAATNRSIFPRACVDRRGGIALVCCDVTRQRRSGGVV